MAEYSKITRFVIYSLSLCVGWFILHDFWLSSFDEWLTLKVVNATVLALNLLDYNAEAKHIMVQINGQDVIFVYHACNGMVLMALFTGFIIAFPGPFQKKLFFIPAGILLINLVNILRVVGLALNAYHYQDTLSFNHKYTFTIIVYAAIFALWMLWVKQYSGLNKKVDASDYKKRSGSIA